MKELTNKERIKKIQGEVKKELPFETYRYVIEQIQDIELQNDWLKQAGTDIFGSDVAKEVEKENKKQLVTLRSKAKFFEEVICG